MRGFIEELKLPTTVKYASFSNTNTSGTLHAKNWSDGGEKSSSDDHEPGVEALADIHQVGRLTTSWD